jgi:glycine/D-amino acid oxidase-like deaminating enzyme
MKKVFVFMLLLAGIWSVFAQEGQAVILEVRGTVEIQDGGSAEWRAATPGNSIGKNAVISTGFKSIALIALGDSRLSIRPLTRLTLEALIQRDDTEEVSLHLRTGRVRADVRPPVGGRTNFTVRSPIATASVRGTSFEFDTRHLYVNDGCVLLEGGNGQMVYVDEGQRSYVDESEQRVIPPFEAEATLLTPTLAELADTGSDTGGYAPVITVPKADLSPVSIEAEW